ncbi:MAG: hypothetical protein PVF04_02810 [Anaerolineae bacterium]|jgi:hypothetical protein
MREKSTGRRIVDLVFTIILLLVAAGAYANGRTMVIRFTGIPIPAWIVFPLLLLVLFSEIRGLVKSRDRAKWGSELASRAKLADLTKAEDYPPLKKAKNLLAEGKDEAALPLLLDELADAHRRSRDIYRELIEQLVSHIFDVYSRHGLSPSFDREQYDQMVEEFRQAQEQLIPLIERYGLERVMAHLPRFGRGMPDEIVEQLRGIHETTERVNKEIPALIGQLPRTVQG